ncbi:hypothetical protein OS493_034617 [Desmophyllum pertusum]|uniref:Uncharacterized protein n=1 Tax=Desmophyllum pertusum TaxID=174260 RepID=A0A9W9ZIU3_9CNID|nr:hypothetical protein OS493_034617 [Desmophyllum pertusum]
MNNDCRSVSRIKISRQKLLLDTHQRWKTARQFISEISSSQIPVRENVPWPPRPSPGLPRCIWRDSQFVSPDSQHVTNRGNCRHLSCSSSDRAASASGFAHFLDLANTVLMVFLGAAHLWLFV